MYFHSNKIKETIPGGSFDTINEDLICQATLYELNWYY